MNEILTEEQQLKALKKKHRRRLGIIAALFVLNFSMIVFIVFVPKNTNVKYGVTFSKQFAQYLGLDWKQCYTAILTDLEVKKIRIPVYWTEVENNQEAYNFENVDWELQEAQKNKAKVTLVVGLKQPRWPECHIPDWARQLNDTERQMALEKVIRLTVNRYKNDPAVEAWQVENEPFLPFGECPKISEEKLDEEIALVRELDPSKPIVVTDSGELSTWYNAAQRGDILGTTLYRIVYDSHLGYLHYPISSVLYRFKAAFIMYMTHVHRIVIMELQGEPWGPGLVTEMPLDEQYKSMNSDQLLKNVKFVNDVEFSEAYLWGVEWWYWLKTAKGDGSLWDTARTIF